MTSNRDQTEAIVLSILKDRARLVVLSGWAAPALTIPMPDQKKFRPRRADHKGQGEGAEFFAIITWENPVGARDMIAKGYGGDKKTAVQEAVKQIRESIRSADDLGISLS